MIRALLVILGLLVLIGTLLVWCWLVLLSCGMAGTGCRHTPSFLPSSMEHVFALLPPILIGVWLMWLGLRRKKRPLSPAQE